MSHPPDGRPDSFAVTKPDHEWQSSLSPRQYAVLRCSETERPGTSPLLHEHRPGVFACAGCGQELFTSEAKFESGSGWPSFFDAKAGAVGVREDLSHGMRRIEIHCGGCGGHLGHVFTDGPQPTGLRYCTNGSALVFTPDTGRRAQP